MESEYGNIYIRHEGDIDRGEVLRVIRSVIVDGRIRCDGIEMRDDGAYWVKTAGEYEVVMPMPFENEDTLVYDLGGKTALRFEVRRRKREEDI